MSDDSLTIHLPDELTLMNLARFIGQRDLFPRSVSQVSFENPDHRFIDPAGLAAIALLESWHDLHTHPRFSYPVTENFHYLIDMGFISIAPLTRVASSSRKPAPAVQLQRITEPLEQEAAAEKLAELVTEDADLKKYMKYCCAELLDNVFAHAGSDVGAVAVAQSYAKGSKMRLAIGDCGVGIKASLSRSPSLRPATAEEAIKVALTERVTGAGTGYASTHAGLGLSIIQEIVIQTGGRLLIISDDGVFYRHGARTDSYSLSHAWQGTLVSIELDKRWIHHHLGEILESVRIKLAGNAREEEVTFQ